MPKVFNFAQLLVSTQVEQMMKNLLQQKDVKTISPKVSKSRRDRLKGTARTSLIELTPVKKRNLDL